MSSGRMTATIRPRRAPATAACPRRRRRPGLYGPAPRRGGSTARRCCCSAPGRARCCSSSRIPAVAAGVADHSDFRADPWRRLAGHAAELPDDRVRDDAARHGPRSGASTRSIAGSPGRATRRATRSSSLWVHATLVDSTIAVTDAWLEPLSRGSRAAFYAETDRSGGRSACPDAMLPADLDAFEAYVAGMLGPTVPSGCRRSPASWRRSCCDPPLGTAGAARLRSRSRPSPTPGRCGRQSGCCRRRSARSTGSPGAAPAARRRPGSWLAGVPGARAARRRSARCRRHSPRIGGCGAPRTVAPAARAAITRP